jgi:hypothetical protein
VGTIKIRQSRNRCPICFLIQAWPGEDQEALGRPRGGRQDKHEHGGHDDHAGASRIRAGGKMAKARHFFSGY